MIIYKFVKNIINIKKKYLQFVQIIFYLPYAVKIYEVPI